MKINKDTKIKIPVPDLKKFTFKVPTLDKIKINKDNAIKFFAMVPLVLFALPITFFISPTLFLIIGLILIINQAVCLVMYLIAAKAAEEERILKLRIKRITAMAKSKIPDPLSMVSPPPYEPPPYELTKEQIEKARKMREERIERERKRREERAERERKRREEQAERERKRKEASIARQIAKEKRFRDMREKRYERDRQMLEHRHSMAQKNSSNKLRPLENALEDVKGKQKNG